MRPSHLWPVFCLLLGLNSAVAGERIRVSASPELAILIDLDLLHLEALGGRVLTHPKRPAVIHVDEIRQGGGVGPGLCDDGSPKTYAKVVHAFGRSTVTLNAELLRRATTDTTVFPCKHGSFRQFLTATLWHELAHVWDRAEGVSSSPAFTALLGSQAALTTTPDAYERKNLREALAVNLEWFLLDPTFACRRPALEKFLAGQLGFTPSSPDCEINWRVFTQSAYPQDHNTRAFSVDPARVYEVHYLFAGKGEELMSRWGHSMLRLVVCAPHRLRPGPECLNDVSHHLVLSYRAAIDDAQISYLDGLRGKYPSLLFIYRFQEILQEYTKLELRELHSVRLPLSDDDRDTFLRITLERFWGYQGQYRFLTNNCGTEALRHLIATDPAGHGHLSSLTPLELYRDLRETAGPVLTYPSQKAQLLEAFTRAHSAGLTSVERWNDFLASAAERRLADYRGLSTPLTRSQLLDLAYLERFVSAKTQLRLLKELQRRSTEASQNVVAPYRELLKRPWEIVRDGYGVPSAASFATQFRDHQDARAKLALPNLDALFTASGTRDELRELRALTDITQFLHQAFQDLDQEIP